MKPATAADIARIGRISEQRVIEILREAQKLPAIPGVTIPDTEL